ncbi:ATP-grasp domain-containing protein [Pareuzebyella sediminis]|uniref:ATP-grasp domain-containing protein n=1 Tax=Pareuzebyella sediminis TaxID=2607998 RepID=UPI0011ECADE0|nr:ATP-grasp domain-containing protein [Pareuzebyella sediminis]
MGKLINILVTGCGGDIGQSIGKILSKSKYTNTLFGIDISDKNAAKFIYPNFSVGLPFTHPNYLRKMELFIDENEIDIVIPIAEPELRFFSDQNILETIGGAKMITASRLALKVGFDKYETAEFLKCRSLPFPLTYLAKDIKTIETFPIILKSRTGSGSKDLHKINTMDEFFFYTRKDRDDFVVQEFIPYKDGEYTCGLFRSQKGEIRSIVLKRELEKGYSGYGEVVENTAITAILENLAVQLNLVGSINIQLRLHKGIPMVFEINPRFSSTIYFRHLFGFEDLIWSIEDSLGFPLSDNRKNVIGRKFYKGYEEYVT